MGHTGMEAATELAGCCGTALWPVIVLRAGMDNDSSIVVPTKNVVSWCERCYSSILSSGHIHEIT